MYDKKQNASAQYFRYKGLYDTIKEAANEAKKNYGILTGQYMTMVYNAMIELDVEGNAKREIQKLREKGLIDAIKNTEKKLKKIQ